MIGFHIILILPPSRRSLDGKKLYTGAGFVSVVDVVKYGYEKGVEDFFMFLAAVAAIYVVLVIIRMFHFYNLDKTNEQVAKIHNTKLTMDDVTGKNLPQDPGAEADKTIAGIDANKNGIATMWNWLSLNNIPTRPKQERYFCNMRWLCRWRRYSRW